MPRQLLKLVTWTELKTFPFYYISKSRKPLIPRVGSKFGCNTRNQIWMQYMKPSRLPKSDFYKKFHPFFQHISDTEPL